MGDPTPKDPLGNARTLRNILERLRVLEQARPLQTAFNDASAAQSTADTAQGAAQQASSDAATANQNAATANQNASAANSAAQTAQQQAQAAQTAAASKTKTTWSTSAPDNTQSPGATDGDTWYVTNGTGGNTTAQYRWNASTLAWTLTPIDGAAIRNIVADTITSGTFTGLTFRSSASGQRAEVVSNQVNFYSDKNVLAGNIRGVNYPWGGVDYPVISAGGGGYGVLVGGGIAQWSGTTVGLRVTGDTAVKRVFLDPSSASDGYICGIYGFQKKSSTDATAVPMPLLYAKGNTSGSSYPDMFIENIKSVTAGDYLLTDGTSISADTGWVSLSAGSGFNADDGLSVRRVGKFVQMKGQITKASGNITGSETGLVTLPAGYRPGNQAVIMGIGAGTAFMKVIVRASGSIDLAGVTATTTYLRADNISFLLG